MKKFFWNYNNGVTALVSEDTLADFEKQNAIYTRLNDDDHRVKGRDDYSKPLSEGLRHLGTPTFTFVRSERFEKSPWFTGDSNLYEALMEHITESEGLLGQGWFHVPFSNGMEIGCHGDRAMASELSYVTTDQQFRDAFGISRTELLAKIEKVTA